MCRDPPNPHAVGQEEWDNNQRNTFQIPAGQFSCFHSLWGGFKNYAIWSSPLQNIAFQITVDLRNESPGMALPKLWCHLCFSTWQVRSSPGDTVAWSSPPSCISTASPWGQPPSPGSWLQEGLPALVQGPLRRWRCVSCVLRGSLAQAFNLTAIEHLGHETRWLTSGFQVSVWTLPCTRAFSPALKFPLPRTRAPPWSSQAQTPHPKGLAWKLLPI